MIDIDIHSHILAGIDDGSQSWDESMKMAREACKNGVRRIIATPHLRLSDPAYPLEFIFERVEKFRHLLERENNVDVAIYQGAELEMEFEIIDCINKNVQEIYLGASQKCKYVLIHFPLTLVPVHIKKLIFSILSKGVKPVLAHPERNNEISRNIALIKELTDMGAFIQVNAGSILGVYGKNAQKNAEYFIKNRWVHFIASDSHSNSSKPIKDAIKKAQVLDRNFEMSISERLSKLNEFLNFK